MIDKTNLLLKHGIQGLLSENEDFFKQNIIQALAIKLHESVQEVKESVSKDLLQKREETKLTAELEEFVNFYDNFKAGTYKFKNGLSINITESDAVVLKKLFEGLNPENRQHMVSEIFQDAGTFKRYLSFSQKVNKLL
jgi:hypothetical protein